MRLLTCVVDVVHDNIDSVVLAQVIHRYDELVVALTAFLTAITTTSCLGYGPLPKISPLAKIVKISLMKNPLARGFSLKILQYYITIWLKPTVWHVRVPG